MKSNNNTIQIRPMEESWLISLSCFLFLVICSVANAAHTTSSSDLSVPIEDPEVVRQGSALFSEKCSACHAGEGRGGGRAPCLTCGKFSRSGNTNSGIYATIAGGIPMTKMGAFGTSISAEEIVSLVTYLRWKEKQRIEDGEISPPGSAEEKPLEFPNTENSY